MKQILFIIFTLSALTACNPAHEYYRISGEQDRDEKKYLAAYAVCLSVLQEEGSRQNEACLAAGGIRADCGEKENAILFSTPYCAETLADVPPGEFNTMDP